MNFSVFVIWGRLFLYVEINENIILMKIMGFFNTWQCFGGFTVDVVYPLSAPFCIRYMSFTLRTLCERA